MQTFSQKSVTFCGRLPDIQMNPVYKRTTCLTHLNSSVQHETLTKLLSHEVKMNLTSCLTPKYVFLFDLTSKCFHEIHLNASFRRHEEKTDGWCELMVPKCRNVKNNL